MLARIMLLLSLVEQLRGYTKRNTLFYNAQDFAQALQKVTSNIKLVMK